ncbi:molybdopterin molybdotransferase MoeA [Hansschlegelia plantiphila]|uniref:Molybdopterin molybdenumtransferase n=1 Tax=Hansschlegelia plantiphila TaxID=374655 RepID=A0A9W6MTZ0_9HYPH|nr:molybdopterin molybdotransferase MoeA [Hansschlegelia plantiphila]GLK66864.1 molybdopterin molybdenumtransferase MoeA [Hansschlegelia plantiphila]
MIGGARHDHAVLAGDLCADPALLSVVAAQERAASMIDHPVGEEIVGLAKLAGRISSGPVVSPTPLPPFDHSAMDGFALADLGREHVVRARLAAGAPGGGAPLNPGEAARILTGAPLPPGAVTVVMQERAERSGDHIRLRATPEPGANIRRRGEDVCVGEVIVPAGVRLDARHIAILAAAGVAEARVRRRVVIGLLSTGDELLRAGEALRPGKIHDANRPMLAAILDRPSHEVVDLGVAPDDPEALRRLLLDAAARCDAIVTSGATSVGDEDHLAAAVLAGGGRLELARVALKPGKPVVAGRLGRAALIGLPGNPFAALVAHMLIGRVALERLAGLSPRPFRPLPAAAGFSQKGPGTRTEFAPAALRGVDERGVLRVEKLGRGGSARLAPLIAADGLAVIPAGRDEVKPGDAIGFLPFEAALEL